MVSSSRSSIQIAHLRAFLAVRNMAATPAPPKNCEPAVHLQVSVLRRSLATLCFGTGAG
jgi:hypothetical protein